MSKVLEKRDFTGFDECDDPFSKVRIKQPMLVKYYIWFGLYFFGMFYEERLLLMFWAQMMTKEEQ